MLAPTPDQDHHQRVTALVGRWLQERRDLIEAWTRLQEQAGQAEPGLPEAVEAFCELLMDYVSAGHFEIYDELIAAAERQHPLDAGARQALLERLQATTDAAIRFNDLCDNPGDPALPALLPRELPILGLELESRFQTEDRLVAQLHQEVDAGLPPRRR